METEHNGVDRLGRRTFLRMTALSGGAMIVAACGGAAPDPATSNTGTTAAPATTGATADTGANAAPVATAPGVVQASGDQVTIDWANRFTTDVTQKVIPLMVSEFEKLYPNIKVKYQNPGVAEGYNETILGRIAAGDPPDVYILDTTPAEYAARGSLLDITDRMQSAKWAKPDAFYPAPLGSCQWQGKTYGLPSSAGPGSVFTNIDMFSKKGLPTDRAAFPKTWDEAKALSKEFVVSDNGTISQAGFVPFVGGGWLYPVWSALNGGQIYDAASNSYKLTSDNNVQWLEYWVQWLDDQYGGNYEAFTTAGNWDDAYPESQFAQSKQAIVHTGSWVTTDAQIPFKFEAAKFPVGPSGSKSVTGFYPNWWTIPAGSKHADEAFLFIEFIATKGWETWYTAILDTPAWRDFPPNVLPTKLVDSVGKEKATDLNKFYADYLADAVPMWNSPIEAFAQQTIGNSVSEVLNKKKSAKDALAEAQQLCTTKLAEVLKG